MLTKSFSIYKLPILSALLISFSYIPFYPWGALLSFVPLWVFVLQSNSLKRVFYGSLITGTLLAAISSYWIFVAITEFGKIPLLLALPLSLLFFLIAQLFIPISSAVSFLIKKYFQLNTFCSLLVLASVFSLFQQFIPTPLPWYASTSFLQYQIPIYHFSDIVGFAGLNTLLLFFNASFAYAYLYKKKCWAINTVFVFLILIGLGHFYGKSYKESNIPVEVALSDKKDFTSNKVLTKTSDQKQLSVQIVQTGIGSVVDYKKYFTSDNFRSRLKMLNLYMKESLKTIKPNTISLWPESSLLSYANQNNIFSKKLHLFSKTHNIPIIFGSWFFNQKHQLPQISLFFYSAFNTDSNTGANTHYSKVKLVAFGETIPFKSYFPNFTNWLYTKLPPIGNFLAEKKPSIKKFQNINFGSQICYESLFPKLSRSLSKQGAQILINVSNDSWYDSWFQPNQHLYTSFSRAIETRLPMIRSTTTGISGVILSSGRVLKLLPYKKGKSLSHIYQVLYSTKTRLSFYTKHPNFTNYLLLIFLFSLLISKYKKFKYN
ncbi:MAG: apolipoprotein N-acyltransferase [Bdellovibrionales bacterium]|nr:apolipoprotein N-acyltransferase [Bdellovibrionales bacterium]